MKNVKFIIPFAAIAVLATTSCGKGTVGRLNREYYSETVDKLSKIQSTIAACGENQVDEKGVYKLPDQGTFTSGVNLSDNIDLAFHAIDTDGILRPLSYQIDNINVGFGNQVTATWDLKNKLYGVTSSHGDVCFVTQVDTGKKDDDDKAIMEWRKYLSQSIGGVNYYINLDNIGEASLDDPTMFMDIKNYIMCDVARNNGYFDAKKYPAEDEKITYGWSGIGLDMSGFGGNLLGLNRKLTTETEDGAAAIIDTFAGYCNYLAPGQLLNKNLKIPGLDLPVYLLIDAIMAGQETEIIKIILPEGTLVGNYTTDGKNATIEFGINLDVVNLQDILDQIPLDSGKVGDAIKVGKDSTGTISLSYFVNFKDNFLYQQELALDVSNLNLQLVMDLAMLSDSLSDEGFNYEAAILDIKNTEVHGYINGLFESGKFVEGKVPAQNIEGYVCLNPKDRRK